MKKMYEVVVLKKGEFLPIKKMKLRLKIEKKKFDWHEILELKKNEEGMVFLQSKKNFMSGFLL